MLEQETLDQQQFVSPCWKEHMHKHLDFPPCKCSSLAQNQGVTIFGNQVHMDFASGKSVSRTSDTGLGLETRTLSLRMGGRLVKTKMACQVPEDGPKLYRPQAGPSPGKRMKAESQSGPHRLHEQSFIIK